MEKRKFCFTQRAKFIDPVVLTQKFVQIVEPTNEIGKHFIPNNPF